MSINRELSQLASFIDVQESNNFIGISTGGTYTVGIGTSSVIIGSTGIITATQFNGPTGSSLIDRIDLQDEGSPVGTGFTTLNFVGTGVTITEGASGIATVTITGTAIIGTSGEVEVTDNGDGTTTLSLADEVGITSSLTVGTVKIESGIITATSGIVTYHGDGSGLTNINASSLSGIATDSDKLDGQDGTYYLDYANFTNTPPDIRWFGTAVGIWTSSSVGIGTTNATSTLTVDGTLNVSGVSTFQDNIHLGDNDKIILGDGNDLEIYHNGSNSYISDQGIGQLRILTNKLQVKNITDNATSAVFNSGGSVTLYHNNSNKFETVGGGVSISSGTASTATIYGPGNLIIDPAPVDDNGGIVRIKGDLYVDGTTTEINSTTLTIDDLNVVVASGATNGLTADGAGLSVAGAGATIKYNYNGGGANEQWVFNKAPYYNTNRILTTADEGTGNGLDADTLDGQEGTHYLDYSNFVGIATDSSLLSGISSTSFLRSDAADIKTSGNLKFNDSVQLRFGTDNDLQIYHSGSASFISNTGTGNLRIRNNVDDGDVIIQSDDGSGGVTDYFRADGSTGESLLYYYGSEKLATKSNGIDVTGHTETDTLNVSGISTLGTVKISSGIVTASSGIVTYYGDGSGLTNVDATTLDTFDSSQFLRSDVADDKTDGRLKFSNNVNAEFGDNSGLTIYANPSNSYITNSNGTLYIGNSADDEDIIIQTDNGSGGTANYFVADGSTGESLLYHYGSQKFATKSNGIDVTGHTETDTLNVSGVSTFQGDVSFTSDAEFDDNVRVHFGTDNDFDIYHVGTHAYLQNSTGDIMIVNGADGRDVNIITDNGSGGTTNYFRADGSSGEVQLYHYGTKKFATKANGIDVTGHTETDTLNVSGIATAQDFNSASDENLKTNIRTIEDPLAKVVQIRGVNFDWKESQRPALGVIAQEIEKVLPELVTDNGTKTVNYNGLIGLLIEAVKAQQEEIDILKSKIK